MFCCKHGGLDCCAPGCGKRARKTGRLCAEHFKAKTQDVAAPVVEVQDDIETPAPEAPPSGDAEAAACLKCARVDATFACEQCNGLLYCEKCSLALRRDTKSMHKLRGEEEPERFPKFPRCPECGASGYAVVPLWQTGLRGMS